LGGLVADANADRFDFGDIQEGDLFVAAELHVKIAPRTPKAPYSKISLWHTDGTQDGAGVSMIPPCTMNRPPSISYSKIPI
jgi:hypothetical protein